MRLEVSEYWRSKSGERPAPAAFLEWLETCIGPTYLSCQTHCGCYSAEMLSRLPERSDRGVVSSVQLVSSDFFAEYVLPKVLAPDKKSHVVFILSHATASACAANLGT